MRLAEPHSIGMLFWFESIPLVAYKCMGQMVPHTSVHLREVAGAIFVLLEVVWSLGEKNISETPLVIFTIKLHDLSKLYRWVIITIPLNLCFLDKKLSHGKVLLLVFLQEDRRSPKQLS